MSCTCACRLRVLFGLYEEVHGLLGTSGFYNAIRSTANFMWYDHCFFVPSTGNTDVASISCSTSVAIAAVVSCAVSFILGALVGAVMYYCTVRKKCDVQKAIAHKQKNQQPAPVYEEVIGQSQNIKLKENVAYGPVQQ